MTDNAIILTRKIKLIIDSSDKEYIHHVHEIPYQEMALLPGFSLSWIGQTHYTLGNKKNRPPNWKPVQRSDPAGTRTQGPNIKSVVLYQLSYEIFHLPTHRSLGVGGSFLGVQKYRLNTLAPKKTRFIIQIVIKEDMIAIPVLQGFIPIRFILFTPGKARSPQPLESPAPPIRKRRCLPGLF